MVTLLAVIAIGFFLGMRHATDPDHVIAITTIVSRQRSVLQAALIGVLWGLGHTLTILFVGAAIIVFGLTIPVRVGLTMELCVGLMLILLGILNLTGFMRWITEKLTPVHGPHGGTHSHIHSHGGHFHIHTHAHGPEIHHHDAELAPPGWLDRTFGRMGLYQALRPVIVGIVHGLAGSAAVALLVLTTIRNPKWAVAYLLIFGIGTIIGMMLITAAIAVPFAYTGDRYTWLNRGLGVASGVISVGFGLFLSYQIAFVEGLFTSHPQWIPR